MRLPLVAVPIVTFSVGSEHLAIAESGTFGMGGVGTELVLVAPLQKPDAMLPAVMFCREPPIDSTRNTTSESLEAP
jgi:hypothetical protein